MVWKIIIMIMVCVVIWFVRGCLKIDQAQYIAQLYNSGKIDDKLAYLDALKTLGKSEKEIQDILRDK